MNIKNLPLDKFIHLLMGVMTAAFLTPFGLAPALLGVFAVAIGKEIWDSMGHGTPDAWDAAATIAGGAALLVWLELLEKYLPLLRAHI